jgi:hypothetical protein
MLSPATAISRAAAAAAWRGGRGSHVRGAVSQVDRRAGWALRDIVLAGRPLRCVIVLIRSGPRMAGRARLAARR